MFVESPSIGDGDSRYHETSSAAFAFHRLKTKAEVREHCRGSLRSVVPQDLSLKY